MRKLRFGFLSTLAAGVAVVGLMALSGSVAGAASQSYACDNASIPGGSYRSITVNGTCTVDAGDVTVKGNVSVSDNSQLFAAFGGSQLSVGGNIIAGNNASLVLGCEPGAFACFNDPDQDVGTLSSHVSIGGSLIAHNALAVLVHNIDAKNVFVIGGGGGVNCDSHDELGGAPAYGTIEDSTISGQALIIGWQSCWLGFIRNQVGGSVHFLNNVTADPDGNEVVTNSIAGSLNCFGNSPAPQVGDSEGEVNIGTTGRGQCAGLVTGTSPN